MVRTGGGGSEALLADDSPSSPSSPALPTLPVLPSRPARAGALLVDLSLFVALGLALSPLLPVSRSSLAVPGLVGFIVVLSYYYFAGTWLLWGKTIGCTIFDVKVIAA